MTWIFKLSSITCMGTNSRSIYRYAHIQLGICWACLHFFRLNVRGLNKTRGSRDPMATAIAPPAPFPGAKRGWTGNKGDATASLVLQCFTLWGHWGRGCWGAQLSHPSWDPPNKLAGSLCTYFCLASCQSCWEQSCLCLLIDGGHKTLLLRWVWFIAS